MKNLMRCDVPLYFATAISGIIMVHNLSWLTDLHLPKVGKALAYAGNNSLSIMILHLMCFRIVSFAQIELLDLPIEKLYSNITIEGSTTPWIIAYVVVGVTVPLLLNHFYKQIRSRVVTIAQRAMEKKEKTNLQ